jgi:hypothetical protein
MNSGKYLATLRRNFLLPSSGQEDKPRMEENNTGERIEVYSVSQ